MSRHVKAGPPRLNRRAFCGGALIGSAGVVLLADRPAATAAEQHDGLVAYPPLKIEGSERVTPGSFLYFNYPKRDDPAVLVRNSEGEYLAFSRRCAHLGCSVEFNAMRRCLACPCHQAAYDSRTGQVVYGPASRPLEQIFLQVRAGGEVWAVGKTVRTNDHRA